MAMPRRVNGSHTVHVLYEREAYETGMVFDKEGHLKGILSAQSTQRLRRTRHRKWQGTCCAEPEGYLILDPKEKGAFNEPWEVIAIDNFNRYFSRVFREGSPLIDSNEIFGHHLTEIVGTLSSQGPILDLGSGNSRYASTLAGGRIISLDLNASPPSRGGQEPASVDKVAGSAHTLPFRDASFALILCLFVLEHLASPFTVLTEICRLLKPHGKVILSFPSSGVQEVLRARYLGNQLTLPIHHLRSFGLIPYQFIESTQKVVTCLRREGCQKVLVRAVNADRPLPASNLGSRLLSSLFPFNYMGKQTVVIGTKGG
jgi:SAM-dependent methyltransferase